MTAFSEFGVNYQTICNLHIDLLEEFFIKATRRDIISWLCWNDSNGIYNDKDNKREFGKVLSKGEAIEIMRNKILNNR